MTLSQSEPEEQEPPGSPLATAFRALSQNTGVYQENLFAVLFGDKLPASWHIAAEDDEWVVRVKVVWQLERLIESITGNTSPETKEAQTIVAQSTVQLARLYRDFETSDVGRRVQRYRTP